MTTYYITLEWLLEYHDELTRAQGQPATLMGDQGHSKLEAALLRPQASAFGEDAYPTLAGKAAALIQAVAIAHAFTNGNKRAAVGVMLWFLQLNGVTPTADEDDLYDFVIAVTTGKLREVDDIAAQVRRLFGLSPR